jgi:hypothetical protein
MGVQLPPSLAGTAAGLLLAVPNSCNHPVLDSVTRIVSGKCSIYDCFFIGCGTKSSAWCSERLRSITECHPISSWSFRLQKRKVDMRSYRIKAMERHVPNAKELVLSVAADGEAALTGERTKGDSAAAKRHSGLIGRAGAKANKAAAIARAKRMRLVFIRTAALSAHKAANCHPSPAPAWATLTYPNSRLRCVLRLMHFLRAKRRRRR